MDNQRRKLVDGSLSLCCASINIQSSFDELRLIFGFNVQTALFFIHFPAIIFYDLKLWFIYKNISMHSSYYYLLSHIHLAWFLFSMVFKERVFRRLLNCTLFILFKMSHLLFLKCLTFPHLEIIISNLI